MGGAWGGRCIRPAPPRLSEVNLSAKARPAAGAPFSESITRDPKLRSIYATYTLHATLATLHPARYTLSPAPQARGRHFLVASTPRMRGPCCGGQSGRCSGMRSTPSSSPSFSIWGRSCCWMLFPACGRAPNRLPRSGKAVCRFLTACLYTGPLPGFIVQQALGFMNQSLGFGVFSLGFRM